MSTPSRYAQVASVARTAIEDERGVIVHLPLSKYGDMNRAKAVARSLQTTFAAWRATQRRGAVSRTGDPDAQTIYDNLGSRIIPATGGDGYTWELFKITGANIGLDVTSMTTGAAPHAAIPPMDEHTRRLLSHPDYPIYDALTPKQGKTDEERAWMARFLDEVMGPAPARVASLIEEGDEDEEERKAAQALAQFKADQADMLNADPNEMF